MKHLKQNSGFSLLELMVVISIVAVLAGMSLGKYRTFVYKAKQTEPMINTNVIMSLAMTNEVVEAAVTDTDPTPASLSLTLSLADNSSSTSCISPNPLGFNLTDCRKVNYKYELMMPSSTKKVFVLAAEQSRLKDGRCYGAVFNHCEENRDIWSRSEQGLNHPINPLVACVDISTYWIQVQGTLGVSSNELDFNGDGTVGFGDFLIMVSLWGGPGC